MHSHTVLHAVREPLRSPALALRRATPGDLPGVLDLLAEAAGWLNSQGVRQWPTGGFPADRIEPLVAEGTLYVLQGDDDPAPAATVALDRHADPEFWSTAEHSESAYYVHKLCTSRAYAGHGLGEALLDWAGLRALVSGLRWLRLDCAKDNPRLQGYYGTLGFRHVRTVDLPHRASGALFQRAPGARAGHGGVSIRDLTTVRPSRRDLVLTP
jgi:ribosomal protein S18 acetylase RimI-like enzyme